MNPDAKQLWRAPRWALAVLLAVLGMLGPFSIDTYIPAFSGIAQSLGATPVQIIVERAMYNDAGGVTWAAGTSALATKLR